LTIQGDSVPQAFVERALRQPRDVVAADDRAGVVNYERVLVGALLMAKRFAKIPAPNVGLLMPASVACDIAFLGLHLAGKLPVVLNWTTGPANLDHAAQLMGLTHIVSSKAFIDRAGIKIKGTQYLHLEELGQQMGRFEKLWTLLKVRWM